MLITLEEIPAISNQNEPILLFIGGFDPFEKAMDMQQNTGYIIIQYPAIDHEKLISQIGTIDWKDNISSLKK